MPVIAVAGALAGAMTVGVGTLAGGLMIAGGVLGGIGAATGNKKLKMLGLVAGVAGGIAGFAGIGGAAASASGAGQTTGLAADFYSGAAPAAGALSDATQVAGAAGAVADAIGPATDFYSGASPDSVAMPGAAQPAAVPQALNQFGGLSKSPAAMSSTQPAIGMQAPSTSLGGDLGASLKSSDMAINGAIGNAPDTSFLGKTKAFLKDNPELIKMGSGIIGGAMQDVQKQKALEYQQKLQDEARARYNNSILGQHWA